MRARKLVLDIGVGKTGSKARQNFFSDQFTSSQLARTIFLETGREGIWHRPLFEELQRGNFHILGELVRELEQLDPRVDTGLISYENLYQLDDAAVEQIGRRFPNLEIVLFVRRQDELISSVVNQLYKAHRVTYAEIRDFEERALEYSLEFDFTYHVRRWAKIVRDQRIHVLPFSKKDSSIETFLRATGLSQDYSGASDTWSNFALDGFGVGVLKELKMMTEDRELLPIRVEVAHKMLSEHFLPSSETTHLLNRRNRRKIMSIYKATNSELCDHSELLEQYFHRRPTRAKRLRIKRNDCAAVAREVIANCSN